MPKKLPKPPAITQLTDRRESFAQILVSQGIDANQSDAYRKAGFSVANCTRQDVAKRASALAHDHKVMARIAELKAQRVIRRSVTIDTTLTALTRNILFDPRKLVDEDGEPIPLQNLDDDTALGLRSIKIRDNYLQDGTRTRVYEYYGHDKNVSINLAMQHLGLLGKDGAGVPAMFPGGLAELAKLSGSLLFRRIEEVLVSGNQGADKVPEAIRILEGDQELITGDGR